jgi:heterodisulfide reductase subunit A-like polyferredoxin
MATSVITGTFTGAPVVAQRTMNVNKASAFMGAPVGQRFQVAKSISINKSQQVNAGRSLSVQVNAVRDGTPLDRPLRVAVIGGGPSGACAAETLAQGGVEAFLIERKMDNCKVNIKIDHSSCIFCVASLSFNSSIPKH